MKIPLKYKTSSPAGDLISFMAGVKKMWEDTGRKGVVYQRIGMPGASYDGSIHPFKNEFDEPICMSQYMFDMLRPLLVEQPYIEDFLVYAGEDVDIDFDLIRMQHYTNQPKGCLNRWFNYAFPQLASDLSKPWLELPKTIKSTQSNGKIIINFTQRYRNYLINYFFLKEHQDKLIFAGLEKERDLFCKNWNLDIPLLEPDNFYHLAQNINDCKFFLGNQSFCFQIAEALKVPRILELFPMMPNVIPVGENAFDFYHQGSLDYYFGKLASSPNIKNK
jgi:hypothetical protein